MAKDNLNIFKDPSTLLLALADFIVAEAKTVIAKTGQFNFVLSGGSSPKKLYELLASEHYRAKIEWAKVFFFFGDERNVPADHLDSNFRMAKESLFEPLGISEHKIFAVNTSLSPSEAAKDYEKRIVSHYQGKPCQFDLILLGLGGNSHTASLFPHTPVLLEKNALVKEVFVEEVKMFRITFTEGLINSAHSVVFLVYGSGKAEAVNHIINSPKNIEEYPAQLIHPEQGKLLWFLDEEAAKAIKGSDEAS